MRNTRLSYEWQGVRRILAVRLDNIGDVLLLQPALRAIKENLRGARLTLLASTSGAQAADLLPEVDDVMARKVIWQDLGGSMPHDIGREHRLIEDIRQRDCDAAIIFTSFSQSPYPPAYVSYLAGVSLRVGMSKEFGGGLLSVWVKAPEDTLHQAERNLFLLEQLGFDVTDRNLSVRIPPEARDSLDRKLAAAGLEPDRGFVLIQPYASCQARTYPLNRMAAVARGIVADFKLPVVVCGHEGDRRRLAQEGVDVWGGAIIFAGQTSLAEYAALVDRARLVVGNNSSSLHLADALGRPCLVTYSGTELESQWHPRRTTHVLLRKPTDCSPCYRFECPFRMECLDFEPEEVMDAVVDLLSGVAR